MPWFHHIYWGRADRLRPRSGHAATAPPHTSGPRVQSTACPRPEDSVPGSPDQYTGSTRRRFYPGTDPVHCLTAMPQLPTRSPDDAAVPAGIPHWPLALDAEPERGLSWASTAVPPASPTRVDSRGNGNRDRTTHCGFDHLAVAALVSSPPPEPRCLPLHEAGSHSGR